MIQQTFIAYIQLYNDADNYDISALLFNYGLHHMWICGYKDQCQGLITSHIWEHNYESEIECFFSFNKRKFFITMHNIIGFIQSNVLHAIVKEFLAM